MFTKTKLLLTLCVLFLPMQNVLAAYDRTAVSEVLGSLMTLDYVMTVFLESECGQYAPKGVKQSQSNLREVSARLRQKITEEDRLELQKLAKSEEFQASLRTIAKTLVTDVLALGRNEGADRAFICGVAFGGVIQVLMQAEAKRIAAEASFK